MQGHTMQLREQFEGFDAALADYGLGCSTRLTVLEYACAILTEHERRGLTELDRSIVTDRLDDANRRFYAGELRKDGYQLILRSTQRFINFIETGTIELTNPMKGSRIKLEQPFKDITERYLASGDFHPNTRGDMRWIACKYFDWLTVNGFDDLANVGA